MDIRENLGSFEYDGNDGHLNFKEPKGAEKFLDFLEHPWLLILVLLCSE